MNCPKCGSDLVGAWRRLSRRKARWWCIECQHDWDGVDSTCVFYGSKNSTGACAAAVLDNVAMPSRCGGCLTLCDYPDSRDAKVGKDA